MEQNKIVNALTNLPHEAQQQVVDFIDFLQMRYNKNVKNYKLKQVSLTDEPFVGIWKNKNDMKDSNKWVRNLRESEWGRDKL